MTKRHKNKGNGTYFMMSSKFWDKSTRQAYMTIKKRAQEMSTNLDGCPDEIVELQAMFNHTSAKKANKKRIKKLQKQIDKSGVDKPNFNSHGNYHKGSGFKDGKSSNNNEYNNNNNKVIWNADGEAECLRPKTPPSDIWIPNPDQKTLDMEEEIKIARASRVREPEI